MRGGKDVQEKIYKTYKPYPVSLDADEVDYCQSDESNEGNHPAGKGENDFIDDFSELTGDPVPADLSLAKPITSNAENSFRPLHLLHSLYADRLHLLRRSLEELEEAKAERERLNKYAMEELDPEIRRCEQCLSAIDGMLNNPQRRAQLERRLFDLTRERRRESLSSLKDMMFLKSEIQKLRHEIDAFGRTAGFTQNREAPL